MDDINKIINNLKIVDVVICRNEKDKLKILTFIFLTENESDEMSKLLTTKGFQIKVNDLDETHTKFDLIFDNCDYDLVFVSKKQLDLEGIINSNGYYVTSAFYNTVSEKLVLNYNFQLLLPQS
ncbi:MAG: hypothetical protein RLZ33_2193 [Bacteroidota bacterium]